MIMDGIMQKKRSWQSKETEKSEYGGQGKKYENRPQAGPGDFFYIPDLIGLVINDQLIVLQEAFFLFIPVIRQHLEILPKSA